MLELVVLILCDIVGLHKTMSRGLVALGWHLDTCIVLLVLLIGLPTVLALVPWPGLWSKKARNFGKHIS